MGGGEVTTEGTKLSELCDSYCLNQLTEEPTRILGNSLSCIDLIVTDQPNLFVDSGVHSSLYAKSHHQIVFGVVNLSVPRPPPYKRTVWEYEKANIDMIKHYLSSINWYEMFDGLDVNQAVDSFTTFFLSVIARHVRNREITCCDGDASWITDDVKKLSNVNIVCIVDMLNEDEKIGHTLNKLRMITDAKKTYYSRLGEKLCDPNVGIKTY